MGELLGGVGGTRGGEGMRGQQSMLGGYRGSYVNVWKIMLPVGPILVAWDNRARHVGGTRGGGGTRR